MTCKRGITELSFVHLGGSKVSDTSVAVVDVLSHDLMRARISDCDLTTLTPFSKHKC